MARVQKKGKFTVAEVVAVPGQVLDLEVKRVTFDFSRENAKAGTKAGELSAASVTMIDDAGVEYIQAANGPVDCGTLLSEHGVKLTAS